jgi:hypothetical protein
MTFNFILMILQHLYQIKMYLRKKKKRKMFKKLQKNSRLKKNKKL